MIASVPGLCILFTFNTCITSNSKNKKTIKKFHLKTVIFSAVKNRCILHWRVFVMGHVGHVNQELRRNDIYTERNF